MKKNKTTKKIAYVVTPKTFSQWTIYFHATYRKNGSLEHTSNITGYGLEQLMPYLIGLEPVLITGKADVSFILKYNNPDVNGHSKFDTNLTNAEYIERYLKHGAVLLNPQNQKQCSE